MILQKFREDNTLTKESLCIKTGLSDATAKREIAYLKRIGVLRRIGSKKNGYTLDNEKNFFFINLFSVFYVYINRTALKNKHKTNER